MINPVNSVETKYKSHLVLSCPTQVPSSSHLRLNFTARGCSYLLGQYANYTQASTVQRLNCIQPPTDDLKTFHQTCTYFQNGQDLLCRSPRLGRRFCQRSPSSPQQTYRSGYCRSNCHLGTSLCMWSSTLLRVHLLISYLYSSQQVVLNVAILCLLLR